MANQLAKAERILAPAGIQLPHLAGEAAGARQALAAHFLRGCENIIEIGGAGAPLTNFLTHRPASVIVIDPKITPYEAAELNGAPCEVRHIAAKLQQAPLAAQPGKYGLALLGLSLKPFGSKSAVTPGLLSLIDNAARCVIDFALQLGRAAGQIPELTGRGTLKEVARIDFNVSEPAISATPYGARRMLVLEPVKRPKETE